MHSVCPGDTISQAGPAVRPLLAGFVFYFVHRDPRVH
jgi:hypothetical protein